jgi:hypothetical protein
MKMFRSSFAAACLLVTLCAGCKREDPVAVIEQAEAKLPPTEQMPPPAAPTAAPAPATDPAATEASYDAWFAKYHLDLKDPKMLDGDADGDGFSNRDEFMADSDPRDPNSRPGIHKQMRLKQYTEVRLPVLLEAVEGESARIKRLDGAERTEKVKTGDTIKGLRWKVEKIEGKQDTDKHGDPIDVSNLTLTELDTKERAMLMKDLPTRTGDSFAELTSEDGQTTIKVKQDQTFKWPNESGEAFKVIDLRADQVIVQELSTRKMWTIPKQ